MANKLPHHADPLLFNKKLNSMGHIGETPANNGGFNGQFK
jgi:hypothetical protein